MKRLWAPWRLEYILMEKPPGCFFCYKASENRDEANLILLRGQSNFALLNSYPYNPGHVLVVPFKHTGELEELTLDELREHWELVTRVVKAIKQVLKPQGFNMGINLGKVAGAGVVDHIHTHIVPRWQGDTNFMPVLGNTKILPQALADTYQQLKSALES